MTEDEAKMRWCPFARVPDYADRRAGVNRHAGDAKSGQPYMGTECLGSGCMAWRWNYTSGEAIDLAFNKPVTPTTGRCGLAGKTP